MNVRVCLVREVEVDIFFEITCVILFLFLLIHSSDVSGQDQRAFHSLFLP